MFKPIIAAVALSAATVAFADNAFDQRILTDRIIGYEQGCINTFMLLNSTVLTEKIVRDTFKLCQADALGTLPEKYKAIVLTPETAKLIGEIETLILNQSADYVRSQATKKPVGPTIQIRRVNKVNTYLSVRYRCDNIKPHAIGAFFVDID